MLKDGDNCSRFPSQAKLYISPSCYSFLMYYYISLSIWWTGKKTFLSRAIYVSQDGTKEWYVSLLFVTNCTKPQRAFIAYDLTDLNDSDLEPKCNWIRDPNFFNTYRVKLHNDIGAGTRERIKKTDIDFLTRNGFPWVQKEGQLFQRKDLMNKEVYTRALISESGNQRDTIYTI
jgi:hypothetical protein